MKMMAATTATASAATNRAVKIDSSRCRTNSRVWRIAPGKAATMPAKMIMEMPLPMPRSVICSPSHMMNAVPVVSVIIVIRRKPHPGSKTTPAPPGAWMVSRPAEMKKLCTRARATVP